MITNLCSQCNDMAAGPFRKLTISKISGPCRARDWRRRRAGRGTRTTDLTTIISYNKVIDVPHRPLTRENVTYLTPISSLHTYRSQYRAAHR